MMPWPRDHRRYACMHIVRPPCYPLACCRRALRQLVPCLLGASVFNDSAKAAGQVRRGGGGDDGAAHVPRPASRPYHATTLS